MSPQLVTYPTWKEMFGKHPTEAELIEEIRPLDRLHSVWLLARINLLLALGRIHSTENRTVQLQTYLVNLLIGEELFQDLRRRFGPERLENRQPFHSLQVLTLMKMITLEGTKNGGLRPDIDIDAAHRLGRCLAMANDFLFTPENLRHIRRERPSIKRKRIALQLQVGSGLEVNNPPTINTSIVRSEMIFGEILKEVPCSLDLRSLFQQRCGMALEDYIDHVFGLLTYYITLDVDKLIEEPGLACGNLNTFFAEGSKDLVSKFWDMELASLDELETSLREPSPLKPCHDFIVMRKRPVLEVEAENVIPMHVGFVQEKLESGLFWAIFNSLKTAEERSSLFADWGHLFEEYVSRMLVQCCAGSKESYFRFPKFLDNGEEAFDGIISEGKYWVVMEYKGGFLNAIAKYAEDEEEFIRDLERKFGSEKGAGIEQLARKIGAVFEANPKQRRHLVGIDSSEVRIVVPVLIVQESFVSSEVTVPYLVDIFGNLKRKQHLDPKVICTFPIILDVSELESLKPYVIGKKLSIVECLMERVHMGTNGFLSFRDFFREYLRQRGIERVTDDETFARFRAIMNRISLRFFKKPFEPAPE
jgi:hypothetical protein